MAIPHAQSAQVIDVRPLGPALTAERTTTLVKTDALEVIRIVLPAGKAVAEHQVKGEITLQCLEGKIEFDSGDAAVELSAGQLIYLAGSQKHSLRAVDDSSLLLTILL